MTLPFTGERCVPGGAPRDIFDQHASRYQLAARSFRRGDLVLDVGSGSGIGSQLLSTVCRNVVGLELDPSSAAFATLRYARSAANLSFVRGDAQRLPFSDATVDGVTAFEVIEHVPSPARLLDEIWRVLRPGGIFLASTPSGEADRYLANPFHISRLTRQQFQTELATRFLVDAEYYQGIVTRRRLVSLRAQARLRRYAPGAMLLRVLLSAWPPGWQRTEESPEEFTPHHTGPHHWPVLPARRLPVGALPYIVVVRCRKC